MKSLHPLLRYILLLWVLVLMSLLILTVSLSGCTATRADARLGGPLKLRVIASPQGGRQLAWEWDHARGLGYAGCATPTSGTNCVGSFEFGVVEVDAKGVSTLKSLGVVDAIANATIRQSYASPVGVIILPPGIGDTQFYVRALGYSRVGQPMFGKQSVVNVSVTWDGPENVTVT